ncbi:MAG: hypothetical protein ABIH26_14800 [Candidatus Eisenbacteria bacterium]
MGARLPRPAILLLAAVVVIGAVRVLDAVRLSRESPPSLAPASPAPLPGEPPLLAKARARDLLAEEWAEKLPPRDPFRSAARAAPPPAAPSRYAIPRIARVVGEGAGRRVVLSFGREESRPLAPAEEERGWKVLTIQDSKVLVENDGVIYSLPLP